MFLYDNMIKGELQTEDGFMIVSIKQEPSPTDVKTEPEDASQQLNVMPEIKTEQQDKSEPDYDVVEIDPSNDYLDRCDVHVCNKRLTTDKCRETESENRSRFTLENYLEPGKQSSSSPSESTGVSSTTPIRNPSRSAKKNSVNYVNDLEANLKEDGSINSDVHQCSCWKCSKARTDPKNTQCDICNKKFTQKRNLQMHIRTVHEKVKAFQCDICDKKFTQNSSLQVHIRTVHDKIKPFKCDVCDKKFIKRFDVKQHIRIVHGKIKPFPCPHLDCPYKAAEKATLKFHLLTHTGEKNFKCHICIGDKRFNRSSKLKKHIRTVHAKVISLGLYNIE